jgi:Protein of unknown function (DUF3995)
VATAHRPVESRPQCRVRALPGAAAAVWALLFAASSAYWAAGGMLGSETVAKALAEQAAARDPAFVATLWAAAALKASLAALALALTRRWGARSGRVLRFAGWATGAALTIYGAFGLVEFGLMALGALDVPADVGKAAVLWYVFLWEPIWVLGGLLFLATARAAPRGRAAPNASG